MWNGESQKKGKTSRRTKEWSRVKERRRSLAGVQTLPIVFERVRIEADQKVPCPTQPQLATLDVTALGGTVNRIFPATPLDS